MDQPPYLTGKLLLSMPGIGDPRFERAVIAMCVHDENGALGLNVTTVADGITVRGLMEQLDVDPGSTPEDAPVMVGGPVEPGRGFILHSPEYAGAGTILVAGAVVGSVAAASEARWALTSTLDILSDIAAGRGPRQWLAVLGYTGWGSGQLDRELTRHGWHAVDGDTSLIFDTPYDARWPRAFGALGINVGQLSATAGRA